MLLPLFLTALLPFQDQPLTLVPPASPQLLEATAALAAMPNTTVHGYEVQGRTRARVRASLGSSKPTTSSGERHEGVTIFQYSHSGWNGPTGCDPKLVEVNMAVAVVLPDLTTRDQLNRGDRAAWDTYLQRLTAHEMNHVRIAQAGATALRDAMRGAPTCEAAMAAGVLVNDQILQANTEYDQRTEHGAKEGIQF